MRVSEPWAPIIAWAAVLLASDLDLIVARLLGASAPPAWEPFLRAALLAAGAVAIPRTGRLLHMRGFVLALAALVTGHSLQAEIERRIAWFATAARADHMFVGVFLTLIPAALMGLTLLRSGLSRRDLFLTWGDWRAASSSPVLRGARWNAIAPVLLVFISGGLILQLWIVSHASRHFRAGALLAALPAAVMFAVLNAGCEEFRFRCVLLARGLRSLGPTHAIWSTSALFGLAHFGGHPSGFSGVAMAGFFAWVLASSMLDTGGWGWAWLLHFVQDVIIFLMVAMTGT